MSLTIRVGMLAAIGGMWGCVANPYEIGFDGEVVDAGAAEPGPDLDIAIDATPDGACVPALEVCNGVDDDCDGIIDNVHPERLLNDPDNCGACGTRCFENNTTCGKCVDGECQFPCCSGRIDCEENPPGEKVCETNCIPTLGGVEECDRKDNDCDCLTDEDFDLQNDSSNCGQCGVVCQGLHALCSCVEAECQCVCDCDIDGIPPDNGCFADVLVIPPGCEYQCAPGPVENGPYPDLDPRDDNPPVDEPELSCDAVDNDCDGKIDDGNPGGGTPCGPTLGECEAGEENCVFGALLCTGGVGPVPEICNNLDDDCDDVTDNGFDKLEDPRYCGDCTPCVRPNTFTDCNLGVCEFQACHPGWVDPDGDGYCDYECTPSGPEICDGLDNDCNTLTDDGVTPPVGLCLTLGACSGTTPTCTGMPAPCDETVRWRCLYQPPAEADGCGNLVLQETLCDEADGDCDGVADDHVPLKGAPCDDGGLGVCKTTGNYICDTGDPAGDVVCDNSNPGDPPGVEVCDGLDNDCDGFPDIGAPNGMVHVQTGGLDFWIDAYEASRPDATIDSAGFQEHRSCSKPNVLPWTKATWTEANQACLDAGYRLCTEEEWQEACEGPSGFRFPYGDNYDPNSCNGEDYDPDCTGFDEDDLLPTGTAHGCPTKPPDSACVATHNVTDLVYDLSGNAKEWTSTQVGVAPVTRRVRGGAYDNNEGSLACDFSFLSNEEGFFYENLGFRCCSTTGP